MISIYAAFIILALYGMCLYLIALWGESSSPAAAKIKSSATTYSLSIAVYCTSWTYYGNIGQASEQGMHHIAIFLGSTLSFILLTPLLKMMVRIKSVYHSTSIADFIATRYNNSYVLSALISLLCLVGIIPYISIQLKSIINTFQLLTSKQAIDDSFLFSQLDVMVVVVMAIFTIIFGIRRLDPTERHPGMMVALAAESILKLFAFICSGLFICFVLFDGFADILQIVNQRMPTDDRFAIFSQPPDVSSWFSLLLLGAMGVIALPRQFHVGVIECSSEKLLDKARWQFPLYLFVINFMVFPIAMAGKIIIPVGGNADLVLLQIPVIEQQYTIAVLVFLGGFAASTGMIMISAMTLSTMATNHLVLPVIELFPKLQFLQRHLLYLRWLVVTLLLFLSLYYFRLLGESELIVATGSMSFVAISQLIPALFGGLLYSKGNLAGALSGITSGIVVWFYTLMLPSFIRGGLMDKQILVDGLFGLSWLNPEQLFGLTMSSNIGHSLFWSLLVNVTLYFLVSEFFPEKRKAIYDENQEFINIGRRSRKLTPSSHMLAKDIKLANKLTPLLALIKRYLPPDKAEEKLILCLQLCKLEHIEKIDVYQLAQLKSRTTSLLAGIIGMAAANKAMQGLNLISTREQEYLSACYSELLVKASLPPDELLAKVDFYQEKQSLLESHAQQQEQAIAELTEEKKQTLEAKQALKSLNAELEQRVHSRTQALTNANNDLTLALDTLTKTQNKLVEAEKMASLGEVVAGVAHEINTPIGVVFTAISTLKEKISVLQTGYREHKILKNDLKNFLSDSHELCLLSENNIQRAADLITSFKQVAVEQTAEKRRNFYLYQCLQDVLTSLRSELNKTRHTIAIECDPKLTLHSFPGAFSQLFANLILNSVLHAFEDEQAGHIAITITDTGQMLDIIYRDNGRGLSFEEQKNLFEPFYTTKRGSGGSGLGGHLIYNLITQRLKGEIQINTQVSSGLRFDIYLPGDLVQRR